MIVVNRAITCGFCGALLASIGFLSTLFSQTASNLVEQFENTTAFWEQFEIAKKIGALHDNSVLTGSNLGSAVRTCTAEATRRSYSQNSAMVGGFKLSRLFWRTVHPNVQCSVSTTQVARALSYKFGKTAITPCTFFGDLKDVRAVPILVPLLKDGEVKEVVPWSLGEIGDKSAIPPLKEALGDNSLTMRASALRALEKIEAKEGLP